MFLTSDFSGSRFGAAEEEGYRARAGMGADQVADPVDLDLAFELREGLFDQICHGSGILITGGLGDVAFAAVLPAVFRKLLHLFDGFADDALFGADLLAGGEAALGIDIQEGADVQQAAEDARRLGHAAAAHESGEVGGEEPVVDSQPVRLDPGCELGSREAGVALVGRPVNQEALAG